MTTTTTARRVEIIPGEKGRSLMPYSEVCMHLRVAGQVMNFLYSGCSVQLLDENGKAFSIPIGTGEAGIFTPPTGPAYYYPEGF